MSGKNLRSERFSVRFDSFYRQDVQRLAGLFCKRELHAYFSFLPCASNREVRLFFQVYPKIKVESHQLPLQNAIGSTPPPSPAPPSSSAISVPSLPIQICIIQVPQPKSCSHRHCEDYNLQSVPNSWRKKQSNFCV
jgi:hypothetical protein